MTVDELLELLGAVLSEPRDQLVAVKSVERRDGDWLQVSFADGRTLAVTVEELG